MKAIKWAFDLSPSFDGFTDGTYWNGFTNVWVTPPVRDAVVQWLRFDGCDVDTISDIAALPVGKDGLVSLSHGYATQEVPR
jgi:hypothetical protein